MEIINENDVHLREFADMIDHLQPKITEFQIEFEQIKTKQEQLNHQAKVRDLLHHSSYSLHLSLKIFENKYRSEYNSLKQWIEIQQQLERILTKLSKDFDQTTQYHSLFQLEQLAENLLVNLNKHEHIENLLAEARRVINSLDQSNQTNLRRSIEQYEIRWKDLRERLTKTLEETSKICFEKTNI